MSTMMTVTSKGRKAMLVTSTLARLISTWVRISRRNLVVHLRVKKMTTSKVTKKREELAKSRSVATLKGKRTLSEVKTAT